MDSQALIRYKAHRLIMIKATGQEQRTRNGRRNGRKELALRLEEHREQER